MDVKDEGQSSVLAAHPLMPAAGLFLLGVAGGPLVGLTGWGVVGIAAVAWALWIIGEWRHWRGPAHAGLASALVLCGAAT